MAVLRRMVGPAEAEDALQETWLRAGRGVERFDGRSSLRTWLIGIAINCAREHRRRADAAPAAPGAEDETALAPPPPRQAVPDLRVDLERGLMALPEGHRLVVVLHDVWGHSHGEIALMLGIEEASSRSRLARARRAIRRWLEGQVRYDG